MLSDSDLERFSRQLLVPGVDLAGQERLSRASVAVVGCGGLGSIAAHYLAAAGIGHLRLIDGDAIALSNLPRQLPFSEADIGTLKAENLASFLRSRYPQVQIEAIPHLLTEQTAQDDLLGVDVVVDGTDNRGARLLIDQVTFSMGVPWVMGGAVQMSGQWMAFDAERSAGCYHCFSDHPVMSEGQCATLGILGPVVGAVAMQQAILVLKVLTDIGPPKWGQLTVEDFRHGERQQLLLSAQPKCRLCGSDPRPNL